MVRPRDPEIDRRVNDAVRALLAEGGYDAVTVASVAERAGTSRPAVYRRWGNRAQLVFEAASDAAVPTPLPDTGSLHGDLRLAVDALTSSINDVERVPIGERLAAMIADREFAASVIARRIAVDREQIHTIWQRAVERREVRPDIDGRTVLDSIVGACLYRILVLHEPVDDAMVDGIVDVVLRGVLQP